MIIEKRFMMLLVALSLATLLVGGLLNTVISTSAQPFPADRLEIISELTGYVASKTADSAACQFSEVYQVYLCPPAQPASRTHPNPAARTAALNLLTSEAGALLVVESDNKTLMVFDPTTGNLVDANFIHLDADATGTAHHALVGPSNTILVSDQTNSVVHEYSLGGDYLGIFAPAGGQNLDIMQNIRGMALRPNGNLLVTSAQGVNGNSVVEFNAAGSYLGRFIESNSGGLGSPFDVYLREGVDWLVSSSSANIILRYELATGDFITSFAPVSSFPQQIYDNNNGNVLVANFSGSVGVHEFAADGTPIGVYNAPGVGGARGVYELPNGNILVSSGSGVFEIDRNANVVETKYSGTIRFIQHVVLQSISLNKTVGLDASTCATTNQISVGPGTAVTYCFEVTNNTIENLTQHDLVDDHLCVLLNGFTFTLVPGASTFFTQTAVITETTTNIATWTAYNPGPDDVFEATDAATVLVVQPSIAFTKTVGTDPSVCADTNTIAVGEGTMVTYCFAVTNTSLTTLSRHDLDDSELGAVLDNFAFDLLPGATTFVTQTAVITQPTTNTAIWTAYNPGPTNVVTATDSATVDILPAGISLAKTVGLDASLCAESDELVVATGTTVTYCFRVTNTGDVSLSRHDLDDSELGAILVGFSFDLLPGANTFVTQTAVITQATVNTATWTAYNLGPTSVVTATDSATVTVVNPAIILTATVGLDPDLCATGGAITVTVGTTVAYCYTVTNSGDITLDQHTITDNNFGLIDSFPLPLAPGASVSVIYTRTAVSSLNSLVTWRAESGPFQATASDAVSVFVEDADVYHLYLPVVLRP